MSSVPVPTQDWDQHYKRDENSSFKKSSWDGAKHSNADVVRQLKQSGSLRGYSKQSK